MFHRYREPKHTQRHSTVNFDNTNESIYSTHYTPIQQMTRSQSIGAINNQKYENSTNEGLQKNLFSSPLNRRSGSIAVQATRKRWEREEKPAQVPVAQPVMSSLTHRDQYQPQFFYVVPSQGYANQVPFVGVQPEIQFSQTYDNRERVSQVAPYINQINERGNHQQRASSLSEKYSSKTIAGYRRQAILAEKRTKKRLQAITKIQRAFRRYRNRIKEIVNFHTILGRLLHNLLFMKFQIQKYIFSKKCAKPKSFI